MLVFGANSNSNSNRGWFGFLRRRSRVDGLPYNPIISLRGPNNGGEGGVEGRSIEFYLYEGGVLQPLPTNESDLLISSGFHHHLDGCANIAVSALGNRPASKAAVELMPTIEIGDDHVMGESHCAVCKEDFEIGSEAKEMPCKHIYHMDCIQPWLSMRNTCPLCRHELPTAANVATGSQDEQLAGPVEENNGAFGLVIWRLPTRSLAVVRFSWGRPQTERLIAFSPLEWSLVVT
ncbi:RING-type E3 ubiquitin transferase [Ranunculus cassubicifolius]